MKLLLENIEENLNTNPILYLQDLHVRDVRIKFKIAAFAALNWQKDTRHGAVKMGLILSKVL